MASKKPVAKTVKKAPAAKKVAPKKAAAPAKKAATPAKKVVTPAKKSAPAPVKKKVAALAKPAPKKAVAPAKKVAAPKPAATPVKKAVAPAKKVAPAKEVAKKAVVKPVAKPSAKPSAKPTAPAKPEPVAAPVVKTVVKHAPKVAPKPVLADLPKKPSSPKANAANPKDIKIAPAKPVAVPKISTKTSQKYQPDFTKSVLDAAKTEASGPLVRYTDSELGEFRELIMRKLESAKKELNYLQGLITRKDDQGGDDTENRYMTMEDGSLSMEREQLSQMASRQITFVDNLQKALMRIENKTYGICRVTGKLIDKARLRAVPHATLSIEAKMGMAGSGSN